MSHRMEQEMSHGGQYEPLPSLPEGDMHTPDLVGGEEYEWAAINNLDVFFTRVYRYWQEKGLVTILTSRLLNLAALGFTILFSGSLLLWVNWPALRSSCLLAHDTKSCDILSVALYAHPFQEKPPGLVLLSSVYLMIFSVYWVWTAAHFVGEVRELLEMKHFVNNKLGISERQIQMMTWSEVAHRLVLVQRTTRLCAARDLDELDIVARIMRKENYLIAMLNAGCLALYVRGCGGWGRRRLMLTKTLEWNLYWCVLDPMFDEHFHIKQEFLTSPDKLRQRLRWSAAANLAISPFLLLFLIIYFFMKNAERFYHSPGSLASRRWSSLARWRLREFNELPHYIQHRLDASYEAACRYVAQFPSPLVNQVAKFVSFVAGSFAALLLAISLVEENLLEVPLAGRNVVWWLALTGILLTVSRSVISDKPVAFDPERAMAELVVWTHYLPRHWRGRAHTAEVQGAVSSMFTFKVLLFAEELASVLLTPFILAYSLPNCADAVVEFVRKHTARVEGVGDVCSMALFDFDRHGNNKYGAPVHAPKALRSKQGKMEKSFLTFAATYPTWHAHASGTALLSNLSSQMQAGASSQHPTLQHQQQQQQAAAGAGDSPLAKQESLEPSGYQPGARPRPAAAAHPQGRHYSSDPGSSLPAAPGMGGPQQQQQHRYPHHSSQQQQAQGEGQGWAPPLLSTSPPSAAGPLGAPTPAAAGLDVGAGAGAGVEPLSGPLLRPPSGAIEDLLGEPAVEWDPLLGGPEQHQQLQQQQAEAAAAAASPAAQGGQQQHLTSPGPPAGGLAAAGAPRAGRSVRFPDTLQQQAHDQHHHPQQQQHQQQHQPRPGGSSPWHLPASHHRAGPGLGGRGYPLPYPHHPPGGVGPPGDTTFQLYPSTLYPGGPSAAAGLYGGAPLYGLAGGGWPPPHGLGVGRGGLPPGGLGAEGAPWGLASAGGGGWVGGLASMAGSTSSEFLPMNEVEDLQGRVALSQSLLQGFYVSQDLTVQHRQQNQAHARSALFAARAGGASGDGSRSHLAAAAGGSSSASWRGEGGSSLGALPVYHRAPAP